MISLDFVPFIFPSILTSLQSLPLKNIHSRDGARFPPNVMLGIQTKEFYLGQSWSESFWCLLANSKQAVMYLLMRSDWWKVAEMVVLLGGYSISTEELWSPP
jgi:hypothetical protein